MHWTIWVVELMITSEKERRSFMEATTHQTVIVTGGATGLGYAIAEQFLRRGANVFLNGVAPRLNSSLRPTGAGG
jgi:hypothetical protein